MPKRNIHALYYSNDEDTIAVLRLYFLKERCDSCFCTLSKNPQIRRPFYVRNYTSHPLFCNACGIRSKRNTCPHCFYVYKLSEVLDTCPKCNNYL